MAPALVLVGLCTDRLFLTWTSSGLETAFFNALLMGWLVWGILHPEAEKRGNGQSCGPPQWRWCGQMAICLWVRQDFCGCGRCEGFHAKWGGAALRTGWPAAVVILHVLWQKILLWRMATEYIFRKVVEPMPDLGVLYLTSFAIEHGVVWVVVAVGLAVWGGAALA